jgi:hypothetical protein
LTRIPYTTRKTANLSFLEKDKKPWAHHNFLGEIQGTHNRDRVGCNFKRPKQIRQNLLAPRERLEIFKAVHNVVVALFGNAEM